MRKKFVETPKFADETVNTTKDMSFRMSTNIDRFDYSLLEKLPPVLSVRRGGRSRRRF